MKKVTTSSLIYNKWTLQAKATVLEVWWIANAPHKCTLMCANLSQCLCIGLYINQCHTHLSGVCCVNRSGTKKTPSLCSSCPSRVSKDMTDMYEYSPGAPCMFAARVQKCIERSKVQIHVWQNYTAGDLASTHSCCLYPNPSITVTQGRRVGEDINRFSHWCDHMPSCRKTKQGTFHVML